MKKGVIASKLQKILCGLRFEFLAEVADGPTHFGKLDAGVLKVAMMVAALDGQVTDDELKSFEKLAKKCRGYNAESAKALFREGLRSAGYVELAARTLNVTELLQLFADESEGALPDGFACGDVRDVRRAFVTWMAMAMSDADYSQVERRAITVIRDRVLDQIEVKRASNARRQRLSPTFAAAYREKVSDDGAEILSPAFFKKAETLIARLNDEKSAAAAAAELKSLIVNGCSNN